MDLLESGDERERPGAGALLRRGLALSPPAWVVAVLATVLATTLAAGVVGAVRVSADLEREAARPRVDVAGDSSSSTVRGVARGRITLLLANRRPRPVQVSDVEVVVEGLQVLRIEPEGDLPLGPLEERRVRVSFVVPTCDALVLPGVVSIALSADGQSVQRTQLPVYDPQQADAPAEGIGFAACPASARGARAGTPTDIGIRPAGGEVRRVGDGVEGFARLEIRNGGFPFQLLSVDAQVPGVAFTPRRLSGGRNIGRDGLVILRLGFRVPDCSRLQKSGRLVLRVERFDGVQELGLRVTAEPAARRGPEVDLRVVLDACE